MKFYALKLDDDEAFERLAKTVRDHIAELPHIDAAEETLASGVTELRTAAAELPDRDIARVLLTAGQLLVQIVSERPRWTPAALANVVLELGMKLWYENTPGAEKLLEMIADAQAGGDTPDDPAFDALEALHARIARDFHFDASENAPPDDEHWARVMDDLVNYADELYLPLANARLGIAEPTTTQEQR